LDDPRIVQINAKSSENRSRLDSENSEELLPQRIYPRELSSGKAVVEWPAALSTATRFRAEEQQVSLRNGNLEINWRDFSSFQTEKKGTQITGTFTNLAPGRVYVMRVSALDDRSAAPLLEVRFATAARPRRTWKQLTIPILFAVLGALAAVAIVQRVRRT
jgi:hypothetical protein